MKIPEVIKEKLHIVSKKPFHTPTAWIDDLFNQADMMRKHGMTEPLSISHEEIDNLRCMVDVVRATEELWSYHAEDIEPFAPEHAKKLRATLDKYRGFKSKKRIVE